MDTKNVVGAPGAVAHEHRFRVKLPLPHLDDTSLTAQRGLPDRRAIGAQLFTAGEFDAAVPLGEYGAKVAYRRSILRDWLVLQIRPGVTWPKSHPWQPREPSWGLGVGVEMFFGEEEFQARPATFQGQLIALRVWNFFEPRLVQFYQGNS